MNSSLVWQPFYKYIFQLTNYRYSAVVMIIFGSLVIRFRIPGTICIQQAIEYESETETLLNWNQKINRGAPRNCSWGEQGILDSCNIYSKFRFIFVFLGPGEVPPSSARAHVLKSWM